MSLRSLRSGTLAALAFAVAATAHADPPKNLKVLPPTLTKDELKRTMREQAKALDVDCDYCHDMPDMASDKLDKKLIAREMMKMTIEINSRWLKGKPKHPVTCATCHRGKAIPE